MSDPMKLIPGNAPERHPATAKVWEWFETDERALRYTEPLRASIKAKIESLDAELLAWDRVSRLPLPPVEGSQSRGES